MEQIDGQKIATHILNHVRTQIIAAQITPRLDIILVGDNPASLTYVAKKVATGKQVGVEVIVHKFSTTNASELKQLLTELNDNAQVNGIIIQLPLPKIEQQALFSLLSELNPSKDVDGLNPLTQGELWLTGTTKLIPATTRAIIAVLTEIALSQKENLRQFLSGKHALIINRSLIIGKPLTAILLNYDCTVTVAHSKTKNLFELIKTADILVTGTGRENFITAEMVKQGVVIIDAGFNKKDGRIYGDVDQISVAGKVSWLSPVPNGIGPIGVAMLIANTVDAATLQKKKVKD